MDTLALDFSARRQILFLYFVVKGVVTEHSNQGVADSFFRGSLVGKNGKRVWKIGKNLEKFGKIWENWKKLEKIEKNWKKLEKMEKLEKYWQLRDITMATACFLAFLGSFLGLLLRTCQCSSLVNFLSTFEYFKLP
jgi:hypothetical protein